jgi:uncharacterized protein YggU (UPF0235/DUF167 family)
VKTRLTLKIRAGAPKTGFIAQVGDIWKLHVAAPPVDGKANEAVIRFLAKLAVVPNAAVRIVTGFTSTTKIVEIDGIDGGRFDRLIQRAILESHGPRTHTGSSAPGKS